MFSQPYENLLSQGLFIKNGSKPTITDYTRDNTIDEISQIDIDDCRPNFMKKKNSKTDIFAKSVSDSQHFKRSINTNSEFMNDKLEREAAKSERAFPRISKALNNTLKDFFFVNEEEEESSIFDDFDALNV